MDLTNKQYTETAKLFRKACELAKTDPTPRQAAKFQTGRGKAFKFYSAAKTELLDEAKKAEAEKKNKFDRQVGDAVNSGVVMGALKPETETSKSDIPSGAILQNTNPDGTTAEGK